MGYTGALLTSPPKRFSNRKPNLNRIATKDGLSRREWQPAGTSFLKSELDIAGATTSSLSEEMRQTFPTFQLAEFIAPDGLTWRNCGADLAFGMTFNVLRQIRYEGAVEHLESKEIGTPRTISLKINRIEAYCRTLDDLPSGWTGLLSVSGEGLDEIREALKDLPEREYLSIERLP